MIRTSSRLWSAALGVAACVAACVGVASVAGAQDVDALRAKFHVNVPDISGVIAPGGFFRGAPGTNSGSPLAFGPGWGDAFVGGGYQNAQRGIKNPVTHAFTPNGVEDGSISGGFGLGDPKDAVGLEVVVTSLSPFRSGLGSRTAFSFKAHRMIDNTSAVAIGVENAFVAGSGKTDGTASVYAVASKVFLPPEEWAGLFKALTLSGGVGNGRFRFLNDVIADKSTVNVFGAASLMFIDQLSAIADWTGQDLNVGVSIVPFKAFPVVFTPAIADVTQTATSKARFILGVGIGMHF